VIAIAAVCAAGWASVTGAETPGMQTFLGLCDASAGVPAGEGCFWVASDEDNVLRLYDSTSNPVPVRRLDLNSFLRVDPDSPEADIEGAARLGETVYWITSHGRNKRAKFRESRLRFLATRIRSDGRASVMTPVGVPYRGLLDDLTAAPQLQHFNLAVAADRAPKASGALNIEALAARTEDSLWVGFRNPVPEGLALLVPLLNPAQVVDGARAELGEPVRLDLGGLGIRAMRAMDEGWWIVAGPSGSGGQSRLYHWGGVGSEPHRITVPWPDRFNPEVILTDDQGDVEGLLFLSDDGTLEVDGCPCKELAQEHDRRFRALWIGCPEGAGARTEK